MGRAIRDQNQNGQTDSNRLVSAVLVRGARDAGNLAVFRERFAR